MNILGIGTDITECLRIARMIERHGEQFTGRVYTDEEIRYCQNRRQATQHFAGRWAAKEAVLKALGIGSRRGVVWRDIEVHKGPGGRPALAIRGSVKELVQKLGIAEFFVSISHCRTHATAYVIALGADGDDEEDEEES
jgi:holo-[acyl-carrier protein] synthase